MTSPRDLTKRAICLIADHLDRILAAGEDLMALHYIVNQAPEAGNGETINAFVRRCREQELTAMAAVLRAREHADLLGRSRTSFAPLGRLFASATAAILDCAETTMSRDDYVFTGTDPIDYLRTRALIADGAGCLKTVEEIHVDGDFLIAGCIHLATLMDMTATFLDALEDHFALFPEYDAAPAHADAGQTAETPTTA
jgi:hypothetical protein